MYKIYLLFILILLPFGSFATTCTTTTTNGTSICVSFDGCGIIDGGMNGESCEACTSQHYNNSTTNSDSCLDCTSHNFDTMNTGKINDLSDDSEGNTECPWKCTNGWYKSGDDCIPCPSNSTTDGAGSLSINDCKCVDGKYMGGGVCRTCPANTTNGCPRGTTAATVQCQSDYTKIISPDGVVTCAQCPQNAILNGTTCECNIGYYATTNGTTSTCTQCPFGTTTVATGATSLGDCQMNNTTRFCDANGENCMNLIPPGITINAQ